MRRTPFAGFAFLAFLACLAALAVARPARAEDPPPGGAGWKGPDFDKDTIALRDEDAPEGWKVLAEDAARPVAEKEMREARLAAVQASGFPADESSDSFRSLTCPGDATVTVGYVDFYKDPSKVAPALKEAAAAKGWVVKEVTSPARLVLVAAPEALREKAVSHVMRTAGKRLAEAAKSAATIQENFEVAAALAKAALALEPKAADAHVAMAYASRPADPKAPGSAWKKSIDEMRAALAPDAAFPLSEDDRIVVQGEFGGFLLQSQGDETVNREARDVLTKAWEGAQKKNPHGGGVGFRYNLACAHARLKEKDKAFEHLRGVLDVVIKNPQRGISGWWLKDPDFDVLKDDPRWKETLEKYPDKEPAPGDGE